MKFLKKQLEVMAVILVSTAIVGCSSSNTSAGNESSKESSVKAPKNWIEDWSTQSSIEAEQAYNSFEKDSDSFTKQYSLNLPDSELEKFAVGKTRFSFNLYSDKDTNFDFLPAIFISYGGKDWKFYKSLMIKFGEDVLTFNYSQPPLREVNQGYVIEIIDFFVKAEDVNFLSKVFTVGEPELRINSENGLYTEPKLTDVELNNLKKVLLAYKYIVNSKIKP